jgi:hypothetical protein
MRPESKIGIGATTELSLRVSVATLVRVLFEHPEERQVLLALERKATLLEDESGHFVDLKAQPFGGAIRIHDLRALQETVGDFHFDSAQSASNKISACLFDPRTGEPYRIFVCDTSVSTTTLCSNPTQLASWWKSLPKRWRSI